MAYGCKLLDFVGCLQLQNFKLLNFVMFFWIRLVPHRFVVFLGWLFDSRHECAVAEGTMREFSWVVMMMMRMRRKGWTGMAWDMSAWGESHDMETWSRC